MTIGAIMMIDGVEIITATYELTRLGVLIGIFMVFGFFILAIEAVAYLKECRADIALALAICCAVLIVLFNPIEDLFTYKQYVVKVSDSVTISELTSNYIIMEQKKDGTLVIREKRSDGKS